MDNLIKKCYTNYKMFTSEKNGISLLLGFEYDMFPKTVTVKHFSLVYAKQFSLL